MNTAAVLAGTGLVSAALGWVTYFATVPSGKVPKRPIGGIVSQVAGISLGAAGIGLALRDDVAGPVLILSAATAIVLGVVFLFLLTQRKTPIGNLRVKVGDPLLPFAALTSDASPFHSDSLAGKRFLLKFFRGGW